MRRVAGVVWRPGFLVVNKAENASPIRAGPAHFLRGGTLSLYPNPEKRMKQEDRNTLRARMETMAAELRESIAALEERAEPVALDQPIGRLSRMDSLANQAISERMLSDSKTRLHRLEHALRHVDDPEFGLCQECGEPIALARLMAMPEAARCVHCAQ